VYHISLLVYVMPTLLIHLRKNVVKLTAARY